MEVEASVSLDDEIENLIAGVVERYENQVAEVIAGLLGDDDDSGIDPGELPGDLVQDSVSLSDLPPGGNVTFTVDIDGLAEWAGVDAATLKATIEKIDIG